MDKQTADKIIEKLKSLLENVYENWEVKEYIAFVNALVSVDELCPRCKTPMSMYCRHEICTPLDI